MYISVCVYIARYVYKYAKKYKLAKVTISRIPRKAERRTGLPWLSSWTPPFPQPLPHT